MSLGLKVPENLARESPRHPYKLLNERGEIMYKDVHFVGGGRITRIYLKGLQYKNALPEIITVCDPDIKTHRLLHELNIKTSPIKTIT
jgi:hypothetical protein